MPLTQREALQLGLLLLCVPLQYMLSINLSTTVTQRSQFGHSIVTGFKNFRETFTQFFDIKSKLVKFLTWFVNEFIEPLERVYGGEDDDVGNTGSEVLTPDQSPAVEVLEYRENRGLFGTSNIVRKERSAIVRFRVGQVVKHKSTGYRAVIIGWDLKAKMPEGWLEKVYGDNRRLSNWPHYTLLIDERDHKTEIPLNAYVVQTRLELLKNTEIKHGNLKEYFRYFDGAQYIPNDKLRKLYPKD